MSRYGTDSITLSGIRVHAYHGVYDFERIDGQLFVIDVTVWLDLAAAAGGDDLAGTINYAELAERVADAVTTDPVNLIETVAERIVGVAFGYEAVTAVRATVHKPNAPGSVPVDDTAVSIERTRRALAGSEEEE